MNEKKMREDFINQLKAKHADLSYFVDLIDDYINLWKIKNLLINDIAERGVVYTDVSSVGVEMQKNNQSVKELVNINKQMLVILEKLKLQTDTVYFAEDEEL